MTQPHGLEGYPPLRKSAFRTALPRSVFALSWLLILPAYLSFNWLFSLFRPTSDEVDRTAKLRKLWLPLVVVCVLASTPIALFALPFYILSHLGRRAFTYHVYAERARRNVHKTEWTIATCNVRLLPEAVARKHNLRNTAERAKQLAVRIASSDMPHHTTPVSNVLQAFPTCDFICLQQVYDRAAVERILFYLNTHWPFILEDTGVLHWRAHRLCAGSGLMLLSKYPIMDAEFKQFPGAAGKDGRFCRGVLMAKVHLFRKSRPEPRRTVGYILVTELHSSNAAVRRDQLEFIDRFSHQFRERTKRQGEIIGFQALTGEFHFDNVSNLFESNWRHDLLTRYEDPFRVMPGTDQPWSITTRINPDRIHDPEVADPANLFAFLLNVDERMRFIEPVEGVKDFVPGLNRTSRVMLQHAVRPQLPARVQQASFVTAIPHVTPLLPVAVRFTIGGDRDSDHHSMLHTSHGTSARASRNPSRRGDLVDDDATSVMTHLATRPDSEPSELHRLGMGPMMGEGGGKQVGRVQIGGATGEAIQMQEYDLDTTSGESSDEEDEEETAVFVDMSEI